MAGPLDVGLLCGFNLRLGWSCTQLRVCAVGVQYCSCSSFDNLAAIQVGCLLQNANVEL